MGELIAGNEVAEHIKMSMEDYTKKHEKKKRADIVSEALAALKMAAIDAMEVNQFCEG